MEWDDKAARRLGTRELRMFLAIARSGSMAKAAKTLATSQPAISKAIADMEHNLGVRLLDRSPQVDADLRSLGEMASSVLLIYDPPPDRPNRIAGRTFFGGNHSSVPLTSRYFEGDGFLRPLHLVMVHEYIHQIDLAFSRVHHPAEFLDPDGIGEVDYPSCIDEAGADRSMRSLLHYNRSCQPINWVLLSPDFGTWIAR